MSHGALGNRLRWIQSEYRLGAADRLLAKTPFSFDVAVGELFWPLTAGAQLVLAAPGAQRDPLELGRAVLQHAVTSIDFVPSMLQAFLESGQLALCPSLRLVTVGAEVLPPALAQQFLAQSRAALYNMYGPTEAAIDVTHWRCSTEDDPGALPIGRPMANTRVLLLDSNLNLVPPGSKGELYLGGENLARGYLGRAGQTAERFVPDPCAAEPGLRLYRTGDLARWRADGALEYLGRVDQQVKIRGYRIELGEIEARLLEQTHVREAAVVARATLLGQQLVAYVVPRTDSSGVPGTDSSELPASLREALRPLLPDYMLPAHIVVLERLPLTPSGKLDRNALPAPEIDTQPQVEPEGELERILCQVFADTLRVPRVGAEDNFFALGGDSIVSLQLVTRAREHGLKVTPREVFEHQTPRALARVVERTGSVTEEQGPATGRVPLLPIQRRFFAREVPERQRYNQALLLRPEQPIDTARLGRALELLVTQHDALRLRFEETAPGQWRQSYRELAAERERWQREPLLGLVTLADEAEIESVADAAQGSLNLSDGPLLRALWMQLPGGGQRLLLAVHHLLVDGVSWRILLEDLEAAYRGLALGPEPRLPAKTSSLGRWSHALCEHARSAALEAELDFWLEQQSGEPVELLPEARLPGSHGVASKNLVRYAEQARLQLSREHTTLLLTRAPEAYRTQASDLLLTALARTLCQAGGSRSIVIELESHGRDDLFESVDVSRTLGWFTSEFPVRLTPVLEGSSVSSGGSASSSIGASIAAIKEQLRAVPHKGIGYATLRYSGNDATRARLAALPEPRVTFNYLGQFDHSFDPGALFRPARESFGRLENDDAPLGNELVINGQVYEGQLRLSCTFSRELYRPEAMQALMAAYRDELELVIEHCLSGASGATPSDFPLTRRSQAQLDRLGLDWQNVEDLYPLSPLQEGLLVHTLLEPGSGIYLMQDTYRIDNSVDVELFRQAWQHVARLHPVLRTACVWNDEGMLQVVQRNAEAPVDYFDHRALDPEAQAAAFTALLEQELAQGFELRRAPLWRVRLIQVAERAFRFVFSHHHILMDAWSHPLMLQDLSVVYQALSDGAAVSRPSPTLYREFIAWLGRRDRKSAARYWRATLGGFEQATPLPMDAAVDRDAVSAVGDEMLTFDVPETLELQQLAARNKLTVNTFVQAAWALCLARYSGQYDVLFGVTVAGRPVEIAGLERTVGLFINSIPLRVTLPRDGTRTGEWLQTLFRQNVAMRQHEHLPLLQIQAESAISRGEPLFHSLFVFENAPEDFQLLSSAAGMGAASTGTRTHTNYPLTVVVYPGQSLGLHLSYDQRLFPRERVVGLLSEFARLLRELVRGFDAPLRSLARVPEHDRARLLLDWTDTAQPYPFEGGYVPLFEAQVRRHPERIAASCAGHRLSFAALDGRANQIAHALLARGVPPDSAVALLTERGLDLLAGILGTFKAGAAYLPLDPKHPPRRLADVLGAGRPRALVSLPAFRGLLDEALALLPPDARPELLWLDDPELLSRPRTSPPACGRGRSLAYVIFTSGSTGVPKGAMVEHAGMLNNQLSKVPWFGLSERDVIAQTASQCFDISAWQLLTGLLCGARVEIVPDAIAHDPAALLAHVRRERISILESVPSLIQALLDSDDAELPLRWLISTGEALPPALARRWLERHPQIPLANAYGPAECSDDVALCLVDAPPASDAGFAPIGTATDNNRLYVLDAELELLPIGVIGELCIAGTGVGRGYLQDPRRSAELFVPHPFAHTPGERLYRSGDLGRYREDGVLECVGRRDQQVKLRGYRIELGEIEARLCQHALVSEAAVVLHQSQTGKRLVGYVVARSGTEQAAELLVAELSRYLQASLPDYMVPAQLLVLAALPLTPNGKLHRQALPDPEWQREGTYQEPTNDTERLLCEVWQAVLGAERVGILDNFFDLGGDSVVSLQMVSRARGVGLSITPRDVFAHQTVQALARVARTSQEPAIDQGPVTGAVPLTPVQAWFFAESIPERHHYNQSVLLRARRSVAVPELTRALDHIVEHHDALRLRYRQAADGSWQQQQADLALERELREHDPLLTQRRATAPSELEALLDAAQASLHLERGPLFRATLIELPGGEQRLLLAAHHLVVDAVSWRVLLEDLDRTYQALCAGQSPSLPAKTTSFQAWSQRLNEHARSAAAERELAYWRSELGAAPVRDLPQDHPRAGQEMRHGQDVSLRLDRETTSLLLSEAPQAYRTQVNDLLLTALARVLCRWRGDPSVLVELEGHGREELFPGVDLSRTVGWFTSAFPVRLTPAAGGGADALGESIKRVKEQLRALPDKGIGFGVLRYLASPETQRQLAALPQSRVTFNYLGQFDRSLGDGDSAFEPAAESAGRSQSLAAPLDNWLSINGQVYRGELSLTCTYSREMYDAQTLERLMRDYEAELRQLIAHCAGRGVVGMTPSDIVGGSAEQADIDAVLADLGLEDFGDVT